MESKEKELQKLLKKQPEEGICRMIDEYGAAVKTICSHILRAYDESLVEDAMQESFIHLWKNISDGKKVKSNLKGYLYQIARNCALDNLRRYKRRNCLSLEEAGEGGIEGLVEEVTGNVEEAFMKKHNEQLVHEVIGNMEEPNRTIFILRYFYYFTVREIAVQMNLKEDNVESRIRRETKKLRKELLERGVLYDSNRQTGKDRTEKRWAAEKGC